MNSIWRVSDDRREAAEPQIGERAEVAVIGRPQGVEVLPACRRLQWGDSNVRHSHSGVTAIWSGGVPEILSRMPANVTASRSETGWSDRVPRARLRVHTHADRSRAFSRLLFVNNAG